MVDEQSAEFIVIPLLILIPNHARRLIELVDQFHAFHISVVSNFFLQLRLIKIKPPNIITLIGWFFFLEDLLHKMSRFISFLNKANYLINFVGNDIPVLVIIDFSFSLMFFFPIWQILFILCIFFYLDINIFIFWNGFFNKPVGILIHSSASLIVQRILYWSLMKAKTKIIFRNWISSM